MPNEPSETGRLTVRVAEEIRALMARQQVTGAQLAKRLGVSAAWVSYRIGTCTVSISLDDLERIADALGVTPGDLLPLDVRQPDRISTQNLAAPVRTTVTKPIIRSPKKAVTSRKVTSRPGEHTPRSAPARPVEGIGRSAQAHPGDGVRRPRAIGALATGAFGEQ